MKPFKVLQSLRRFGLKSVLVFTVAACADLDAPVYDKVANFWLTPEQVQQGVAHAYVKLRSYGPCLEGSVYELHETCTDEIIVPVRGSDWTDQGVWDALWKHKWNPNTISVQIGWRFIFSGIDGINLITESLQNLPSDSINKSYRAEMETLRAFYYYQAIDLFGRVPIVEKRNATAAEVATNSRLEVFEYIEREILENLPALSHQVNLSTYGRATQWFAYALLAKLYLNAKVFTGTSRWPDCIAACDAILTSGKYTLEADFFKNFAEHNDGSKENIFVLPFDYSKGLGSFMLQAWTLHYQSGDTFGMQSGGFNGFCSTAEYLSLFDDNDVRKKMFLVGQQYVDQIEDEAHKQYTGDGTPLFFDPVITSFHIEPPKTQTAGARCAKWEFNKQIPWVGTMSNDFAVYRLADIILMKAEAQFMNGDVAGALTTINKEYNGVSIRSRAGLPDFTSNEITLDGFLKERARELSWEGHRRNDMIRLGHFTDARIPDKAQSEDFRALFPIPQAEIDKNKFLVQNDGYD